MPEYQYRHHWETGMVVFWDNVSVQHYAVHDYYPQRRRLNRITIKGGAPEGVQRLDPARLHRLKMPKPKDGSKAVQRPHLREGRA